MKLENFKHSNYGKRGFTFVEALVVVAIFSGFMIASAGVFVSAYRSQAGSYNDELDEQSNMRGAFELEHLFRSSLGYELLNGNSPDAADQLQLWVPNPTTGAVEVWEFYFQPDGTDNLNRIKGSFKVKAPGMGESPSEHYVFTSNISLPAGRSSLFVLDDLGRVTYHWVLRSTYTELAWKGNLSIAQ